jgi:hypothetical protein
MSETLPPGSRNKRYHCKKCGTYVAEDATRPLGVLALPLSAAADAARATATPAAAPAAAAPATAAADTDDVDLSLVPEEYRPNHHIFYADRVTDVADNIPKWKTLPQGDCLLAAG